MMVRLRRICNTKLIADEDMTRTISTGRIKSCEMAFSCETVDESVDKRWSNLPVRLDRAGGDCMRVGMKPSFACWSIPPY